MTNWATLFATVWSCRNISSPFPLHALSQYNASVSYKLNTERIGHKRKKNGFSKTFKCSIFLPSQFEHYVYNIEYQCHTAPDKLIETLAKKETFQFKDNS